MAPLIELRGLTVEIPTPAGWIRPVDDVSFALDAGESLGLVGESGSGKSMLALALMGLLPPGARVISVAHRMADVKPDEQIVVDTELGAFDVYLWKAETLRGN